MHRYSQPEADEAPDPSQLPQCSDETIEPKTWRIVVVAVVLQLLWRGHA